MRRAFRRSRNRRLRRRDRLRRSACRPCQPLHLARICAENRIGAQPEPPFGRFLRTSSAAAAPPPGAAPRAPAPPIPTKEPKP